MSIFARPLAAALLLALTFVAVSAEAQQRRRPPPPMLVGDAVRMETASETAAVVGRFVSLRGGPVAARVNGAVDKVMVEVGDRVAEGDVLIVLASERLQAEHQRRRALVSLASARIRSAKASLRLAQQAARRLSRLKNSAAFSEARLSDRQREAERAAAQVREAEADYARARAELRLAEVDLAYGEVRAPYDGVVAERHVDVGGFVSMGAPAVTLVGDKALEVEAEAPSDRMGGVRPGAEATVSYRGVTASVSIRAVLPRETGVSRTRTVRFGPLPEQLAKVAIANAAVTVNIPVADAQSMATVHKDAIVRRAAGAFAVVAKPAGDKPGMYQAEMRRVRLGSAIGRRFTVLEGVAPGDVVVIRGNETLRPGQPFRLPPQGPAKASGDKAMAGKPKPGAAMQKPEAGKPNR